MLTLLLWFQGGGVTVDVVPKMFDVRYDPNVVVDASDSHLHQDAFVLVAIHNVWPDDLPFFCFLWKSKMLEIATGSFFKNF